jgi:hypothetical protein
MNPEQFYAACNLQENPFRTNPVIEDDPRMEIWVGYDRQKSQLVKLIDRVRSDKVGLTSFALLYGQYGTGKSHALLWARNQVKKDGVGVSYFMPTLKKDKGKLSFSAAFSEDLISRGSLLHDLLEFKNFIETRGIEIKGDNATMGHQEVVARLINSRELAEFLRGLWECRDVNQISAFLNTGKQTDYQAVMLFAKIVNLFVYEFETPRGKFRFKKAVYLLIDELDDLSRQPGKEILETNDTLRHIYDACPNSFGLIGALSAEITTLTNSFTDYVLSRVTRQIHFELLDRDTAVKFVGEVLDGCRADPAQGANRGFFPFDEDAITAVMSQLREITPRKIVNTMQQVIEEFRLQQADPAGGIFDVDALDRYEIIDTVFGEG